VGHSVTISVRVPLMCLLIVVGISEKIEDKPTIYVASRPLETFGEVEEATLCFLQLWSRLLSSSAASCILIPTRKTTLIRESSWSASPVTYPSLSALARYSSTLSDCHQYVATDALAYLFLAVLFPQETDGRARKHEAR